MPDRPVYSSPCSMADTNPAYHGFLTQDEVRELLSTLLHAERAGVRICVRSRHDAPSKRHQRVLRKIQKDEAKSCRGLIESLKTLGYAPDSTVDDFAETCLAIPDFNDRLRFFNRGHRWVARKIADALPRIQQERIQRQLAAMLDDHRRNIATLNAFRIKQAAKVRLAQPLK